MKCHTESMGEFFSSKGKMEWQIPLCLEIIYILMSGDYLKQKKVSYHGIKERIISITMQPLIS